MNKKYNIKSMTIDDFKELIANGDDTHNNQVRVTKDGKVFLSQDIVGSRCLDNIAMRFETFCAHNNYVGIEASKDERYVKTLFNAVKKNWKEGVDCGFISEWD